MKLPRLAPGPRTTALVVCFPGLVGLVSGCPSRREPAPSAVASTEPPGPGVGSSLARSPAPPLSAAALPSAPPVASVAPRSEVTLSLLAEHEGGPGANGFTSIFLVAPAVGLRSLVRRSSVASACRLDELGPDRWAVSCAPSMLVSVVEILRQGDTLVIKPTPPAAKALPVISLPADASIRLGEVEASGRTVPGGACPDHAKPRPVRLDLLLFSDSSVGGYDPFSGSSAPSRGSSILWLRNTSTDAMLTLGNGVSQGDCDGTIEEEKATIECKRARVSCTLQGEPSSVLVRCGGPQGRTGRLLLPCGSVPRLAQTRPQVASKYN